MGFKREDIFGTTPLDIKKINDNIKMLWLKVFGNLDFADLSEALKGVINNKVGTTLFNTTIQQTQDAIALKATKDEMNAALLVKANEIALKANQSTVDTLTGRVSNAESNISVQAGQITSKVSKDSVISTINQSAESITINANKIALTGVVTATDLATAGSTTINGANITTGTISASLLRGIVGAIDSILASGNIQGWTMLCNNLTAGNYIALDSDGTIRGKYISITSPPWAVLSHNHSGVYATSSHSHTYFDSALSFGSVNGAFTASYLGSTGNIAANGSLSVTGSKNCVQTTENYGKRLISAYETAEYYFGDIGRGTVTDGECTISLDPVFMECVNTDIQYEVFLSKYGQGDIWVDSLNNNSFVVKGSNIPFAYEVKAKRKGYETSRLEEFIPQQ